MHACMYICARKRKKADASKRARCTYKMSRMIAGGSLQVQTAFIV